ncbi:hypothetical protein E4U10_000287 [Claviceps purpurea]|nr:hypothetical protein E4U10_000287 [Claviceps purpurea]
MATLGSHIVRGEMHHAMAHAIEGAEAFRGLHDLTGTFVSFLCSDLLASSSYISALGDFPVPGLLCNGVKGAGQPPPCFPVQAQFQISQDLQVPTYLRSVSKAQAYSQPEAFRIPPGVESGTAAECPCTSISTSNAMVPIDVLGFAWQSSGVHALRAFGHGV